MTRAITTAEEANRRLGLLELPDRAAFDAAVGRRQEKQASLTAGQRKALRAFQESRAPRALSPYVKVFLAQAAEHAAEFVAYDWIKRGGVEGQAFLLYGTLVRTHSGILGVGELSVVPYPLSREHLVSADVLRAISLERIIAGAREQLIDAGRWFELAPELGWDLPDEAEMRSVTATARRVAASRGQARGRRGYPANHYRGVALEALKLQASGIARGYRIALARQYHVQPQTIGDWIARARELGFLEPGQPGRAALAPGPMLKREDES